MEKREKPPSLTECVEFDDMAGREEEKNGVTMETQGTPGKKRDIQDEILSGFQG